MAYGLVTVTIVSGEDYSPGTPVSVTVAVLDNDRNDYDADNDGLIDVRTLAQLNAMRWDLDGNGDPDDTANEEAYSGASGAFPWPAPNMGCPSGDHDSDLNTPDQPFCAGYELRGNLDFQDWDGDGGVDEDDVAPDWYDATLGWLPVGGSTTAFAATFDGNSNLFIHRSTSEAGLFGRTGADAVVENLGLVNVNVTGGNQTGGLAGNNLGRVTWAYVTGSVRGGVDVGGLAGASAGRIGGSYATASVTSNGNKAGGLVGYNKSTGTVAASYATGIVVTTAQNAGGLAGRNDGTITASWTTGVLGEVGGNGAAVVGNNTDSGVITASYFDSDTSHLLNAVEAGDDDEAAGKTTSDLKASLATSDIFVAWNVDIDGDGTVDAPWDFGGSSDYPVLKGGNDNWQTFGCQLRAGPDGAPGGGQVSLSWTAPGAAHCSGKTVGYRLHRNGEVITGATESPYEDTGLDNNPNFPYEYQLAAVIDGGTAAWAALATATPVPQVTGFTVTPNPVVEANDITVTVTLDTDAGKDIDVAFAHAGGVDFDFPSSTFPVPDGDNTGSRTLSPQSDGDDTTDEPNGVITFSLGGGTDYSLAPAPDLPRDVVVAIHDDDGPQVRVEVVTPAGDAPTVAEGGTVTFKVAIGSAAVEAAPVNVEIAATGEFDVTAETKVVTIAVNGTEQTFTVDTTGDSAPEVHGSITATVTAASAGEYRIGTPASVTVTVLDDDRTDYDADNDNLIDVDSLAKLNAMRWDLDGDGAPAAANAEAHSGATGAFPWPAPNMGCPLRRPRRRPQHSRPTLLRGLRADDGTWTSTPTAVETPTTETTTGTAARAGRPSATRPPPSPPPSTAGATSSATCSSTAPPPTWGCSARWRAAAWSRTWGWRASASRRRGAAATGWARWWATTPATSPTATSRAPSAAATTSAAWLARTRGASPPLTPRSPSPAPAPTSAAWRA